MTFNFRPGPPQNTPIRTIPPLPSEDPDEPPAAFCHSVSLPPVPRSRGCLWPIGQPGEPGFRFCEAPRRAIGGSYCFEHERAAKVKAPGR